MNTNEREFVLVNRKIEPKNLKGPTTKSVREKKESSRPQRTTAKKRRKSDQEQYSPEASTPIKTKVRWLCSATLYIVCCAKKVKKSKRRDRLCHEMRNEQPFTSMNAEWPKCEEHKYRISGV